MGDERKRTLRCPGGYLVTPRALCGRSGNNCVKDCAFAYRDPYWAIDRWKAKEFARHPQGER